MSIDEQAVLRFEHGDVGEPAVGYLVGGVDVEGDIVRVSLNAPGVACKVAVPYVKDNPVLASPLTTCCTPIDQVA